MFLCAIASEVQWIELCQGGPNQVFSFTEWQHHAHGLQLDHAGLVILICGWMFFTKHPLSCLHDLNLQLLCLLPLSSTPVCWCKVSHGCQCVRMFFTKHPQTCLHDLNLQLLCLLPLSLIPVCWCKVSQGHSVQISDGYVDNMMTLYRLRCPSGRPPDYT